MDSIMTLQSGHTKSYFIILKFAKLQKSIVLSDNVTIESKLSEKKLKCVLKVFLGMTLPFYFKMEHC